MKIALYKRLFIILTTLAVSLPVFAGESEGGNHGGGGGITAAAHFHKIARGIGVAFKNQPTSYFGVSGEDLINKINAMDVEPAKGPLKLEDGKVVDAINFPDRAVPFIKFDEAKWNRKNSEEKVLLVIHELLGLVKTPDPQYKVSSAILLELIQSNSGDWKKTYKKILDLSQPDLLKSVYCKFYFSKDERGYNSFDRLHNLMPDAIFYLTPGQQTGYQAGEYFSQSDGTKIAVKIEQDIDRRAIVTFTPSCEEKGCYEGEAQFVKSVTIFMGAFKYLEAEYGRNGIRCMSR